MMPLTSSTSNDSIRISDIPLKSLHHNTHLEDVNLDGIQFIDENENIECVNPADCREEDAATNEK